MGHVSYIDCHFEDNRVTEDTARNIQKYPILENVVRVKGGKQSYTALVLPTYNLTDGNPMTGRQILSRHSDGWRGMPIPKITVLPFSFRLHGISDWRILSHWNNYIIQEGKPTHSYRDLGEPGNGSRYGGIGASRVRVPQTLLDDAFGPIIEKYAQLWQQFYGELRNRS